MQNVKMLGDIRGIGGSRSQRLVAVAGNFYIQWQEANVDMKARI